MLMQHRCKVDRGERSKLLARGRHTSDENRSDTSRLLPIEYEDMNDPPGHEVLIPVADLGGDALDRLRVVHEPDAVDLLDQFPELVGVLVFETLGRRVQLHTQTNEPRIKRELSLIHHLVPLAANRRSSR